MTGSKSEITFKPLSIDDPKFRQPDISKAKKLLNWEPKVSRADGLKKNRRVFSVCLARIKRKPPALSSTALYPVRKRYAPHLKLSPPDLPL